MHQINVVVKKPASNKDGNFERIPIAKYSSLPCIQQNYIVYIIVGLKAIQPKHEGLYVKHAYCMISVAAVLYLMI